MTALRGGRTVARAMNAPQQTPSLTLDEYAERLSAGEEPPPPPPGPVTARRPRVIVAVFGGTDQKGRWRLGRHLWIVAVLGGATLDIGQAEPEAPESVITVLALLGGVELRAPAGVPVQLTGLSLFGGKSDDRPPGPRLPGCPVVHVRGFCILGGVKVTERKDGPRA